MSTKYNVSETNITPSVHTMYRDKGFSFVYIGTVKSTYLLSGEDFYIVEVQTTSQTILNTNCRSLSRFGGAYNFEEIIHQGYNTKTGDTDIKPIRFKGGDKVLVAFISGNKNSGVILGGLKHDSRLKKLNPNDGPAYISEFNGLQQLISSDGEYLIKHRGLPTNISELNIPRNSTIPEPTYNSEIGGSFLLFSKDGSISLNDGALTDPQFIKIDKPNGSLYIKSGKTYVYFNKNEQSQFFKSKTSTTVADDKIISKTKEYSLTATSNANIESPKIAFGTKEIELLDRIIQTIDAIGTITVMSPVGPCAPINSAPQWGSVDKLKQDINKIKGKI